MGIEAKVSSNESVTPSERMAVRASQELKDRDVVFVGIGLPNVACNLARATHAPNLFMIYESGAVGTVPKRLPISIGDPALVTDSISIASQADIFQYYLQGGRIEVGFLGGAQVDPHGNINTTVIGPYAQPKVRLPGSGGASEIATHAKRLLIMMRMSPKTFVKKCDFVTSPGRRAVRVITDLCVCDFDNGTMVVSELYDGVTPEAVQKACGFELRFQPQPRRVAEPSQHALKLLRETLDPKRLYL